MARSSPVAREAFLYEPVLHGEHRFDVDAVADRYTDLMLQDPQPVRERAHGDLKARLARLEALVAAHRRSTRGPGRPERDAFRHAYGRIPT